MEINTWTSTTVLSASQDSKTKTWTVKVKKADGTERVFHVNHVVLATGFKGGKGYVPTYPGMVGLFLNREACLRLLMIGFVIRKASRVKYCTLLSTIKRRITLGRKWSLWGRALPVRNLLQ